MHILLKIKKKNAQNNFDIKLPSSQQSPDEARSGKKTKLVKTEILEIFQCQSEFVKFNLFRKENKSQSETIYPHKISLQGQEIWIKTKKKLGLQIPLHSTKPVKLTLRIKLFPQQIDDVIQDITIRLFYLNIKNQVLSGNLYVDNDTLVSLASYQVCVHYSVSIRDSDEISPV